MSISDQNSQDRESTDVPRTLPPANAILNNYNGPESATSAAAESSPSTIPGDLSPLTSPIATESDEFNISEEPSSEQNADLSHEDEALNEELQAVSDQAPGVEELPWDQIGTVIPDPRVVNQLQHYTTSTGSRFLFVTSSQRLVRFERPVPAEEGQALMGVGEMGEVEGPGAEGILQEEESGMIFE